MTPAEELYARAEWLAGRKWVKGCPKNDGESCLMYDRVGGKLMFWVSATHSRAYNALRAETDLRCAGAGPAVAGPVMFNDLIAETVEDVILLCKDAAARLENG